MPALTLERLEKRYDGHQAVVDFSLAIREGEFVSLLGPSGCGKTTVLRMVAGLLQPTSGAIFVDDRNITHLPPDKRRVGLVFQSYALFPHLTVFENVAYGLRRQGIAGEELRRRVDEALEGVRLTALAERMPRQLSGGQQQRVALARSIAPRPSILLLDEPLSNLDASLREEMQIELKRLQRSVGITTVFVTHDQAEAMTMSDRVCVMAGGIVQQFDSPEAIYHRPATAFVASFIGRPNRFIGRVLTAAAPGTFSYRVTSDSGIAWTGQATRHLADGETVEIVVRQEDLRIVSEGTSGVANLLHGQVNLRAFAGSRVQYVVRIDGQQELVLEVATSGPHADHGIGDRLSIAVDPSRVYLNPASSAAR